MKVRHRIASALLLLVAVTTCQAQTLTPAGAAELDRYLENAIASTHIPGLVALVVNSEGIVYERAFGLMDVAGGKPMRTDAIFRIASMTKPVTSVAVMLLVEEDLVSLDAPVEEYLPELAGREVYTSFDLATGEYTARPAAVPMTVRHLLTHTSGLGYTFDSPVLAKAMAAAPGARATAYPLLHEPGSAWTYGESTRVLGELVERVSGEELFAFMQARILTPLGMHETFYDIPAALNGRTVTVHRSDGTRLIETPNPTGEITAPHNGDGGLSSTARDYAQFIRMFLNDGRLDNGSHLLESATVESMGTNNIGDVRVQLLPTTNPLTSKPFPLGAGVDTFGLGFQITEGQLPNMRSPGSMAWAGIFNTEFWIDPERGIGAVLLMQLLPFYDEAAIEVLQGFEERIYRNLTVQ